MTYFHTGIRTIIGAESFHCPVRDGKEWYQLAMVVRHNFLSSWVGREGPSQDDQFIELISFFRFLDLYRLRRTGILNASTWHNFFEFTLAHLRVFGFIKVIGSSRTSN